MHYDSESTAVNEEGLPAHTPPPYRPPVGIPMRDEGRWRGFVFSAIFHLTIVLLIIVPVFTVDVRTMRENRRAAGSDQPGGGGGGLGGLGGATEDIFFLNVDPATGSDLLPTPQFRTLPQPEEESPPEPVPEVEPPQPDPPLPELTTEVPPRAAPTSPPDADSGAALSSVALQRAGEGGGSGTDGTRGDGPGSGGGVGAGVGTGQGSGVGPGTGLAGADTIFPPQLLTLGLPPLQPPSRVRPYTLVALFDVDERGATRLIGFNETRDGRFNRQLRDVLRDVRFRPATLRDGTPVRDTGRFVIEYP